MAQRRSWDAIVVGAGVFGAWTAWRLRKARKRVLLVDLAGPAHARASSGGESRMTRAVYGADAIYTRMATASLVDWRALSRRTSLPIFHETGVLFFFNNMVPYAQGSIEAHRAAGLPTQQLDRAEMQRRWPQINFADAEFGLFEPRFGVLMARRSVQEVVAEFVRDGGEYRIARAAPAGAHAVSLNGLGETADAIVYACGPWLPRVFPEVLGDRIFVTRQEILFFATPPGDTSYEASRLPGWADYNGGDLFYGMPQLESRGFKVAHDKHGAHIDPDTEERVLSAEGLATVKAYVARRFPGLAGMPLVESRVCQYENSSNGDFLMDRHPTLEGVWLLGGGSGHGFKHGPEVGRMMAELVMGRQSAIEPRFSLASKAAVQNRSVL
ncbi:MAG: FAD-dependent oxidoreductase [Hyphomonadaceae bacterium]|nr:FAD-dependent oxidoreductase [Hyphomonadaceae bacterium]